MSPHQTEPAPRGKIRTENTATAWIWLDRCPYVDYLAFGAARYIGKPKTPTISVYQLVEGEYLLQQFQAQNRIQSATFPELQLTSQAVFDSIGGG